MPIKAVIIDDESQARNLLAAMLKNYAPDVEVCEECKDLPHGVKAIRKHNPDLVFLDIEMPGHSGLELLDFFDEKDVNFSIIFTTAYNHYAIQAFKLSAVDYLLKPIEPEELENALERFRKKMEKTDYSVLRNNLSQSGKPKIALNTGQSIKFIPLDEILFFKADGSYTQVHLKNDQVILVSKSLKYFEDMLIPEFKNFFRCHKSFIVNTDYITDWLRADGGSLVVQGKYPVSLSSEKAGELGSLLNMGRK